MTSTHVRAFHLRPPYDASGVFAYLASRAIPGVEAVSQDTYRRAVRTDRLSGILTVRMSTSNRRLIVECPNELLVRSRDVEKRLRRVFDLRGVSHEATTLLVRDPRLAAIIRRLPGLRVPGGWDGFELAVRAILGQQVSVKGATTLAGRLVHAFGERVESGGPEFYFPSPQALASANVASIGMPKARGRAINALSAAVCEGKVAFKLSTGTAQLQSQLTDVPGIGPWTAQYVAMRALHEPDAYPAADLGLLRAAARLGLPDKAPALEQYAERWKPFRAYAVMAIWRSEELTRS